MGKMRIRRPNGAVGGVALLSAVLAACSRPQTPPSSPAAANPAPAPSSAPEEQRPVPTPPLGRSELIQLADAAADAAAQRQAYPSQASSLIGRAFSIRLPFGCRDQASDSADARIEVDQKRKTMVITAQPQRWTDAPWIRAIVGDGDVEAIEGFWIRRPWSTSNRCPPMAPPVVEPAAQAAAPPKQAKEPAAKAAESAEGVAGPVASAESLGLARIYRAGDSRLKRHDKQPYKLVLKLSDEKLPANHQLWLHLEGRLVALEADDGKGEGHAVACGASTPDRRPICLVGVDIDRAAIEAQDTGAVLGDWPG